MQFTLYKGKNTIYQEAFSNNNKFWNLVKQIKVLFQAML